MGKLTNNLPKTTFKSTLSITYTMSPTNRENLRMVFSRTIRATLDTIIH